MTRKGRSKNMADWSGRLANARAYLQHARDAVALGHDGMNANPIVSHIVLAAIAFSDALTAKLKGSVNQQDHRAAPRLLRDALGNRLPNEEEKRFRTILEEKDVAQYGVKIGRLSEAKKLLEKLERFAAWAETELRRP